MKFSILMPTYNDEKYIIESINSLIEQDYSNWELIIINDGSTDSTESVVKSIKDKRIIYKYQDNSDQLNAILDGSDYITGDIVFMLHSDDLLADSHILSDMKEFFMKNENTAGIYSDFIKIDSNSGVTGGISVSGYNEKYILKSVILNRGSNSIGDPFAVRKIFFNNLIRRNYLTDNTIYYISYDKLKLLDLKKFRPWYKYRVFEENYINSDVGKFVETNGRLRTVYKMFNAGLKILPAISVNSLLMRIIRKFNLHKIILIKKTEVKDWNYIIKYFSIWRDDILINNYPELLLKQVNKIIESAESGKSNSAKKPLFINYKNEFLYYGKDARLFYKHYNDCSLNLLYKKILEEKYDYIVVDNEKSKTAVETVLKFYSLFYKVEIAG